ncbi:hypothetical protein GCM10010129_47080 [Streptomyces fumigatiscleroticus]|nr:hypothetical protein GCM10010129_47080 [Streptomyces fumigatiscleroticus]
MALDADMEVRGWNRASVDLWGLRDDEVLGENFFRLDLGLAVDRLEPVIQKFLETSSRSGCVSVPAVNRLGRSIVRTVVCTPSTAIMASCC